MFKYYVFEIYNAHSAFSNDVFLGSSGWLFLANILMAQHGTAPLNTVGVVTMSGGLLDAGGIVRGNACGQVLVC